MSKMEVLNLKRLFISYGGAQDVVSDLSMAVKDGEIACIVGESGSGKSTLLHAVLGILPGTVSLRCEAMLLLGRDISGARRNQILRQMRGREVSMIFQDAGRYMNPTARIGRQYRDFLKSHERISNRECRRREEEMLLAMGLDDPERILHAYPFELSGGMCQRVAIAMAMTLRPRLLLADEPTSALDVTVQAQVVGQMARLREQYGTAIVMVTHNMGVAAHLADRIGVLQQGRMVEWERSDDLIRNPRHPYTRELMQAVMELDSERLLKRSGENAGKDSDSDIGTCI